MLRTVLIVIAAAVFVASLAVLVMTGVPLVAPLLLSGITLFGLLFERFRYTPIGRRDVGPRFEPTGERFIDPETGVPVTVYIDPATGARRYISD